MQFWGLNHLIWHLARVCDCVRTQFLSLLKAHGTPWTEKHLTRYLGLVICQCIDRPNRLWRVVFLNTEHILSHHICPAETIPCLVLLQILFPVIAFPAFVTLERLLPRVPPVVYFQVVFAEECFVTRRTLNRALLRFFRRAASVFFAARASFPLTFPSWSFRRRDGRIVRRVFFICVFYENLHAVLVVFVGGGILVSSRSVLQRRKVYIWLL